MKVPTYERQSTRTTSVGATALSVQASPAAVSAGTRAAQQFFDQATQESLSWYETELSNKRKIEKRKADIASEEEALAVVQQSAEMDPNEAETYFDTEMLRIKRQYADQFDNDLQRQNFEIDFDRRAIARRVAVRSDASERRIGDAIFTYEKQLEQIQRRIIYAPTNIARVVAEEERDNLYKEMGESGYLTETDIQRSRIASNQFVAKESFIARINAARSVEEQQTIIGDIQSYKQLMPSTMRELINKSEDEINEILAAENKAQALKDAIGDKVSEDQRFQLENRLRLMKPEDAKAWLAQALEDPEEMERLQDVLSTSDLRALLNFAEQRAGKLGAERKGQISRLSTLIDGVEDQMVIGVLPEVSDMENLGDAVTYLGNEPTTRRFQEVLENVETTRLIREKSPGQIQAYLDELRKQFEESESGSLQRASFARQIKFVTDYQSNLEKELNKGNHLEFFSKSGQIELVPIDINDMVKSFEQRASDIQSVGTILIQGTPEAKSEEPFDFTNLTRNVNFFTEPEIQEQIAPYIAKATSAEKFLLAKALGNVKKYSPNIFSQIDRAGGDSKVFAMVSAIGDFNIAKQVFDGQDQQKQGVVDKPTEAETRTVFESVMGPPGEIYDADDYKTMQVVALGHYAATRIDRVNFVASELEASIQAVSGGIGEYNGYKVELPRGVNEETFTAWIKNLSPRMIEYFAPEGIANMTYEEAADLFKNSRVRSTPGGGYEAIYNANGQEAVFTENAESLRIFWNDDMAKILAEERERPGQDPSISTGRERWLYLSSRPTGFLSDEEKMERSKLTEEFGRASDIEILEFRAQRLEAQNKNKEAQRVRDQIENIKSQQRFFGFGGGD